jgi:hypothetical protein
MHRVLRDKECSRYILQFSASPLGVASLELWNRRRSKKRTSAMIRKLPTDGSLQLSVGDADQCP